MKVKNIHFREHAMFFVLVPLIVFVGILSFYRFMVKHDYVVGYQGACDPATGKCFMSCNDDSCTTESYYSEMQKYEPDLFKECGKDITNCEAASVCFSSDRKCSKTYCDKETSDNNNVCQTPFGEQSNIQDSNQTNSINNTSNTNI